jgi:hypothetical protein
MRVGSEVADALLGQVTSSCSSDGTDTVGCTNSITLCILLLTPVGAAHRRYHQSTTIAAADAALHCPPTAAAQAHYSFAMCPLHLLLPRPRAELCCIAAVTAAMTAAAAVAWAHSSSVQSPSPPAAARSALCSELTSIAAAAAAAVARQQRAHCTSVQPPRHLLPCPP